MPDPSPDRSIITLIRDGTLDTELAATLWLLVEARVPVIVAAEAGRVGKSTMLDALLAFLPAEIRVVRLAGEEETFDWLAQASELGWPSQPSVPKVPAAAGPIRPAMTVIYAAELSDHLPIYTWGKAAQVAVRAASVGYGLAATIHADSLDDVFETLRRWPVRLSDDELSHLGVVLVMRRLEDGRRRVVAAHYVRPVARDVHGHLQRLGPAVLATWDAGEDAFEHFGWGVTPELARRVGRRAGDFEVEVGRRREHLGNLVATEVTDTERVLAALRAYRPVEAFDHPRTDA
ncbi:MAG: hypothetical protein ACJ77U_03385 [Chloroflexota bacterium]